MAKQNQNSSYEQQPMDEQHLSQKMHQLSTGTTTTAANEKQFLVKDIKVEMEKTPIYLTKRSKSFQTLANQVQSTIAKATTTYNIDELRKIAVLIYKIRIIQMYQRLWTAYLKSAKGELIMPSKPKATYSINLPIWPKEVKAIVLANNLNKQNEQECYLTFVHSHLLELEHQLKQYQLELNIKANPVQGYTLPIQKMIEIYIEQNLDSLRMKIEHQVELVQYDYHIHALKIEYLRLNPNTFQEQLMKALCQSKYEQETTEQEVHFLKQQITYYTSPNQSFECSSIAHDPLVDSIQNPDIRQQLIKQFKEIAEQSRANIFTLYMTTAEEQREEYKQKHETNLKKMWDAYRSPSNQENISPKMLDLIHQRCMKISERIKSIYKFKLQSIGSKS